MHVSGVISCMTPGGKERENPHSILNYKFKPSREASKTHIVPPPPHTHTHIHTHTHTEIHTHTHTHTGKVTFLGVISFMAPCVANTPH